ncbi:unnamed protein product [Wickerhamomyces anomalus]
MRGPVDLELCVHTPAEPDLSYIQVPHKEDETVSLMNQPDDIDYPEGSLKGYLAVFGSFMGLMVVFGLLNILGVLESYVNEHQLHDQPSSTVGWIFSIFTFGTYLSCIFSGTYFDRSGSRVPLVVGTVLLCCGLVSTASCKNVWSFILGFSVLTSIGNGCLMSPLVSVIAHYFKRKRAFYSSVATVGGSVGGVYLPIVLRKLFVLVGFVWAIRILALINFTCLLFPILLSKERLNQREKYKNDTWRETANAYLRSFDVKAFKDWKFVFCSLGAFFAEISAVSVITFYTSYALKRGISMSSSYLLVTLLNAGSVPGRLVTGYLADRFGRYNVMIITTFLMAVLSLSMWLPFGYSVKVLYAFSVIYGLVQGSIFSLLPVCCGQISRTEEFGKRYSTMYVIVAIGCLAGVPAAGAIVGDRSIAEYNHFIIYASVTALASSVCYTISKAFAVGRYDYLAKF